MSELTQARLKYLFTYDPETGTFVRNVSICSRGQAAGSANGDGYLLTQIDGNSYRCHRLAWFYVHGCWPVGEIDHIDGNSSNNQIANLRDVSRCLNQQNLKKARKNSKSGLLGVRFNKTLSKWAAQIWINGRQTHLGYFLTAESAHAAYIDPKRQLHPGCTI